MRDEITINTIMLKIEDIRDKRIAVLLSGGVDSSVVVYELARMGLHPDCFYIKIGPEERKSGTATPRKTWRWLLPWPPAFTAVCK